MGLYDGYQLGNSTATPAFVGSDVDTKIGVLQQLNQRYLEGKAADDALSRSLRDSVVAANDQPLYNEVTQRYRDNMARRAQAGNYEDMQQATAKDAYDFASQYKAFAMNHALQQNYLTEIQKASDRGADGRAGIGSDVADMLKAEMYNAPGLKMDSRTGQISGFFRAPAIAIGTDKPKKVKEWAADVVAHEVGSEVKSIEQGSDGMLHYVTKAGTSGTVTPAQIQKAVAYGMKIDDQFRNDVQQESRLRTNGLERYTYDDVAAVHKDLADKIQEEAQRTGQPFGMLYRNTVRDMIEQQRANDIQQYATKYTRNDHTSKYEDTLADPSQLTKNTDTFGIPMDIPLPGHQFNTPDAVGNELAESQKRISDQSLGLTGYLKGNNDYRQPITSTKDGRYTTADGKIDVTEEVKNQQSQIQAEQNHRNMLDALDKQAQKDAGYKMSPQLRAQAQKAYRDKITELETSQAALDGKLTESMIKSDAQRAYDGVLDDNPHYQAYKKLLLDRSKGMVTSTTVTRFPKEDDNKQMEALGNGLTVNDFKKSLVGGWKLGTNGQNEPLDPSDYENLKGDINFTGMGKDANGNWVGMYTATNKKTGDKVTFGLKGVTSNKSIGQMMNIDATDDAIDSEISRTLNNPSHSGDIQVPGSDVKLHIAITNADQIGTQGKENYRAILKAADGRQLILDAPDKATLIDHVKKYYAAHAK